MTETAPILVNGEWRGAEASDVFHTIDPATGEALTPAYPVSRWSDLDAALDAAASAYRAMRGMGGEAFARFIASYASLIEADADGLTAIAHRETALDAAPRLRDVELPRTLQQLRLAAEAARDGGWALPTIDTEHDIRSCLGPIGPVCVFGPNNFPFAYGCVSGGDFAAAIAAGNPVIGKAHPAHAGVDRRFAELARQAAEDAGLPPGAVQLLYHMGAEDGLKMVADPRNAAIGFTGGKPAGLAIKRAAEDAGKLAYLEMSSVNPVVILPGALAERSAAIADALLDNLLMGTGQFCTCPGLVFLAAGEPTEAFLAAVAERLSNAPAGTLLTPGLVDNLTRAVGLWVGAGADLLTGGKPIPGGRCAFENTAARVSGDRFLDDPQTFQTEAFGNASLYVVCRDVEQIAAAVRRLEGNLTGSIWSRGDGSEDEAYRLIEPDLRQHVGRMLNDRMTNGVTVTGAMNHGGPYPATGHGGFTAVGVPASLRRFAMLRCYDHVRHDRLPPLLQDPNPTGRTWRMIDEAWTQADVGSPTLRG